MKGYWKELVIIISAFILYGNTLQNGFVLDDYSAIVENRFVQSGTDGISDIFSTHYRKGYWSSPGDLYRPLVLSSFAIEHQYTEGDPFLHHLINILFYAGIGVILFHLISNWLPNQHPLFPLLVALLFLAHPIHTEVVANIKSRDEIMSLFFALSGLLALDKYFRSQKISWLIVMGIVFLLALLSKESSLVYLLLIPLTAAFFYEPKKSDFYRIIGILVVPALLFLNLRHKALSEQAETLPIKLSLTAEDPIAQLLLSGYHLILYVYKLVFPFSLASQYPEYTQGPSSFVSVIGIIGLIFHAGLLYYGFKWFKNKDIKGYLILFYLITHFLHSNLILVIGTYFGERLLFTPSVAFSMASGLFIVYLISKFNFKTARIVSIVILLLYSGITIKRNKEWFSNTTLYAADVVKQPESALLNYWQSLELTETDYLATLSEAERKQNLNEGLKHLEQALELNPNYGEALAQIALVYYKSGDHAKALVAYEKALEDGKGSVNALNNVAAIYFGQGDFNKAKSYYEQTVKINPYHKDAWGNLGITYAQIGEFNQAENAFRKAIEINPNNAQLYFYLGMTLNQLGKTNDATAYFEKAFELDPSLKR